jgi:integrase
LFFIFWLATKKYLSLCPENKNNFVLEIKLETNNKFRVMARKKRQIKEKSPVAVRVKDLANGNQRVYLDIYWQQQRSYDYLKDLNLILVPETSPEAKARNANTLELAKKIKDKRVEELKNNAAGVSNSINNSKMLLPDWIQKCIEHKRKNGGESSAAQLEKVKNRLIDYKGDAITMKEVDKDFCIGFIEYLRHATSKRGKGKPIRPATAKTYESMLIYALNRAVKKDIILFNPMDKLEADERIKVPDSTKAYLTIDELGMLIATPCINEPVKQAYLFACFCGLRLIDIENLTWGDIEQDGTRYKVKIVMQKTQTAIYQPLSDDAIVYLPERSGAKDTDKVFHLPSRMYLSEVLNYWAQGAGIKEQKHVTFHTSRHTFATLLLTKGIDLYTVSKLLGHTDVKTTQVYGKVIDSKKEEAVDSISGLFDVAPIEVEG